MAGRIFRAVHACNNIVRAQVSLVSRRFEDNLSDYRTFGNVSAHLFGNLIGNGHQRCTDERNWFLRNFLIGFQLIDYLFNGIDGNRKADTLGIRAYRYVHPDNLAVQVKQRAAGVTRVNRSIGLQQVLIVACAAAVFFVDINTTVLRTEHTGCYSMVKALRVTDSDNFGANLDTVGIAKRYGREVCAFNFQHCKIQVFT
ncbi:hypothetical protein D3C73_1211930 [compost metagenome]